MVGTQAQAHPDLVKKVVAAGHRLCDHTVSHNTAMDKDTEAYQSQQILDAERMITKASGGVRPMYYRAPGGAFTPYSRKLAAAVGMAVAARGRDVEPRRDLPAEIAVEGFVVGGFGEHDGSQLHSSVDWPGIAVRRTASLPLAYARPSTSYSW